MKHRLGSLKQAARELLMGEEGLEHRGKRPIEGEAVFGHIKECGKFRRFRLRGMAGASIEFGLKALAHNLRKLALLTVAKLFFRLFSAQKRLFTIKMDIVYTLVTTKVA